MSQNIFEEILEGKTPCDKVLENKYILAFRDIAPLAPVHILFIPKISVSSLQELQLEHMPFLIEIIKGVQQVAKDLKIEDNYRLVTNHGLLAGQTIPHLHFHLLGGKALGNIA